MSSIPLNVREVNGRQTKVRVPADATYGEVTPVLAHELGLPDHDEHNNPIGYEAVIDGSRAEASRVVREGDNPTLSRDTTAG